MTLTPEQFKLLATKDDLKKLKEKLVSKNEFGKMLNTLDGIAKNVMDIKNEQTVNIAAHDRMQSEINETRNVVGLKIKSKVAI